MEYGFGAGCEDGLCPSVDLAFSNWATPAEASLMSQDNAELTSIVILMRGPKVLQTPRK
jgi:hypothetical protein